MLKRSCAVFLAVALTDALWTWYTLAVASRQPLLAGLASAAMVLAGIALTRAVVRDGWAAAPAAAAGAFAGTFLTVRFG